MFFAHPMMAVLGLIAAVLLFLSLPAGGNRCAHACLSIACLCLFLAAAGPFMPAPAPLPHSVSHVVMSMDLSGSMTSELYPLLVPAPHSIWPAVFAWLAGTIVFAGSLYTLRQVLLRRQ